MKKKLGLLYGGKSAEHDVSLRTAKEVINALDYSKFEIFPIFINKAGTWVKGDQVTEKIENIQQLQFESQLTTSPMALTEEKFDIVFPLLHGPNGEDGTVQGLLELLNIPYVGNGVLASSAGMDKVAMKQLFAQAGLKQPKYVWCIRSEWKENTEEIYQTIENELKYPCFVKPANLGSSVGISKARNREELIQAFELAFKFDRKVIIEEGIIGREIEVAVMGNDYPSCSAIGEILPKADFYDYEAKYQSADTGLAIPAQISEEVAERMKVEAIRSFKALDCSGLVRADFFLVNDQELLINEVNTMPGFTPVSMYPMLWQEVGMTYAEIIERLIELGIERHQEKQEITFTV